MSGCDALAIVPFRLSYANERQVAGQFYPRIFLGFKERTLRSPRLSRDRRKQ